MNPDQLGKASIADAQTLAPVRPQHLEGLFRSVSAVLPAQLVESTLFQ